jgi:2',3'-cyclic-nucleotide 2'-phosphodiesterase (5'-nucleotidase family)
MNFKTKILIISLLFASTILCSLLFAETTTLQILTTSDSHGRFVPYNYETNKPDFSGSLAQIATEVKKLRSEIPNNTILVDNGDILQENSQSLFVNDKVNPMILAMNEMGYDLINIGNHEFNYGIPTLKHVMSQFKAADGNPNSILCGNVYDKDGKYLFTPYKIVTTKDGVKVGFIGMVTPNITKWDGPNLKGYKVTNPVAETKKVITEIKDKVDVLIAIDHMGEESEYGVHGSGVMDLAKECPELDLIICGHAHMNIPGDYYYDGKLYSQKDAPEVAKENGTLIIEPGCRGEQLGQILINLIKKENKYIINNKVKDIHSKLISMKYKKDGKTEYIKADSELTTLLEPYNKKAIEDGNKIIGELVGTEPLAPVNIIQGISQRELQPNAMIQLINNVQLYYADKMMEGKDIKVSAAALLSLDGNVLPGKIKKSDMSLIYKYPNTLYVLKMNGQQLRKFMEYCAGFFNQYKPGDLTISFNPEFRYYLFCNFAGVTYDINISKPAGQRIENLKWKDGKPVKPTDEFYMTTNNYMANSQLATTGSVYQKGDCLPKIVAKSDNFPGMGNIQNLLADYIANVKHGKIEAACIPNWKITGNDWNKKQHQTAVKLINDGNLSVQQEYAREPNAKSITWSDVKKVLKNKAK